MAEDCADVARPVLERVPRPRPVLAGVPKATAIGVDQPSDELLRPSTHMFSLPVRQSISARASSLDRAAGTGTANIASRRTLRRSASDAAARASCRLEPPGRHRRALDDSGISVEDDAHPVHLARMSRDAPVPQVETQEIDVVLRQPPEVVCRTAAARGTYRAGGYAESPQQSTRGQFRGGSRAFERCPLHCRPDPARASTSSTADAGCI